MPNAVYRLGVLLVVVTVSCSPRETDKATTKSATAKPTSSAGPIDDAGDLLVDEAQALLDKGDLEAAHAKIEQLSPGSSALDDPAVARIEGKWADDLFAKATLLSVKDQSRTMLARIVNAKYIDEERRKKAQAMIDAP